MDKYEKKAIVLNCTTNLYNEDIDVWYTSDMVINFEETKSNRRGI